jgi:hypothetical protein
LVVLVPAHNEEDLVGRCVAGLLTQTLPRRQYRVVVIADNCSDATARVAIAAGAEVWVRTDPEATGKGAALAWAFRRTFSETDPPDAVVVVDADSKPDLDFLRALEAELSHGAEVVQADYVTPPETRTDVLRTLAICLFNRVRNRGRAALGLPVPLLGNGMLFNRRVAELGWNARSAVEDLEFSLLLRVAGVRPRFATRALVWGKLPERGGETVQRLRWEGGRLHLARRFLPRLVREAAARRDGGLLDAAIDLAVPPLTVLALLEAAGVSVTAPLALIGAIGVPASVLWALASALLVFHVLLGSKLAGPQWSLLGAVGAAPGFLAWKLGVYFRLLRGHDPAVWIRSRRPGDAIWR